MERFKPVFFVVIAMLLIFTVSPIYGANEVKEVTDEKTKIVVDDQLSVYKFNDGRIEKVKDAHKLTKEQRKAVLKLMKFTDEEINTMSPALQQDILSDGGVKVELTTTDVKEIYTDLSGKDHVVTDKNREEIKKLIEKDLNLYRKTYNKGVSVLAMGSASEGNWYGMSYITYNGLTSTGAEYKYDYYTSYTWNDRPGVAFTDTVTHAWQSHTTGVTASGQHAWQTPPPTTTYYWDMNIDKSSVAGTQGTFDLWYVDGTQYGHLKDSVVIPTRHEGETGAFVSGYAHPYSGGVISAILDYLNISFDSGWGMKKTWNNTFTISKSY